MKPADDSIEFGCGRCGYTMRTPNARAGQATSCPSCQGHVRVPGPDQAQTLAPPVRAGRGAGEAMTHPSDAYATAAPPGATVGHDRSKGGRFGRYVLGPCLGRGGFGEVHRAHDPGLSRDVALKRLLDTQASGDALERFRREAKTLAKLRHPSIVPILEAGVIDDQPYLAMDFIEGEDLGKRCRESPLNTETASQLLAQVARAIAYAHENKVVHRDLKPQNILVDREGQPWVLDFGLALTLDAQTKLTKTGEGMGTLAFMSPQQANGERVGKSSDVYALGATLYYLLTGRPPFIGETAINVMARILGRDAEPPSTHNAEVERDLDTICLKCLEKARKDRYPSATALAEELDRFLLGDPIEARPIGWAERWWRRARRNKPVTGLAGLVLATLLVGAVVTGKLLTDRSEQRETLNETTRALKESKQAEELERDKLRKVERATVAERKLATALKFRYRPLQDPAGEARLLRDARDAEGRVLAELGELLASPPRSPELWVIAGRAHLSRLDLDAAKHCADAALAASSEYGSGHLLAAEVHTRWLTMAGGMANLPEETVRVVELEAGQGDTRASKLASISPEEVESRVRAARLHYQEALRLGERPPALTLAWAAIVTKDWPLARRRLETLSEGALSEEVEFAWAVYVLRSKKAAAPTLARLEKALSLCPRMLPALLLKGYTLHSTKRSVQALPLLDRTLVLHPGFTYGFYLRSLIRGELGHLEGAVADCTRANELDPDFAPTHHNRGLFHLRLKRPRDAIKDFSERIRLLPRDAPGWRMRALAKERAGRPLEAVSDYQKAIQLDATDPESFNGLGVARRKLGDMEGAIKAFTRSLELEEQKHAYSNRGYTFASMKRHRLAVADYSRALDRTPVQDAVVLVNRSAAWTRLGEHAKSERDGDRAIELNPKLAAAHYNRGYARMKQRKAQGAFNDFSRAIQLDPRYTEAYYERGKLLFLSGHYAKAAADGSRAATLAPDHVGAHFSHGSALYQLRRLRAALAAFSRAIALRPEHPSALTFRASVWFELDQTAAALKDVNQAIKLKETPLAFHLRARVLLQLKRGPEAALSFEQSLRLSPTQADASKMRRTIKRFQGRASRY